ncbi:MULTISPECIES: Ldh family oxidoreductase [unclassified Devosia]|uniref:Ldh family oxidoreductase n=1 Tax=unclassified Devosia TaxID=196773 RepID=UPI001554415D
MTETSTLRLDEAFDLSVAVLVRNGFAIDHATAVATVVCAGQRDECHSHGLYRLLGCVRSIRAGKVDGVVQPELFDHAPGIVRVDAKGGYSLLAFEAGRTMLVNKARQNGIAALVINHCYHFSALWPEVEALAAQGVVAIAMTPSHNWVAPFGGTKPVFGTNPLAFAWPRPGKDPYVFDFATSSVARGEIELHRRAGKPIPLDWAVDESGAPTDSAEKALSGAMTTFGGHKGSALSTMIELIAGPLIGDLSSIESKQFDNGAGAAPYHGELLLAFDPQVFTGVEASRHADRAEIIFDAIIDQGARLPSQRRYAARARSLASGEVEVPSALLADIRALL